MKRILVATDFSEHSQIAILKAIDLAKSTRSQLTILHVAKKGFWEKIIEEVVPVIGRVLVTPEEYAASLLKKEVDKFSKNKMDINYLVISGDHPAQKILKYANDHRIDLLIIGAHGKYSIHDWFVGTTAEYVARKTQVPVLIIKKPSHKPYRKILVPIDFSSASKNAVQLAGKLFPNANLQLLHVGDHEYRDLLAREINLSKAKAKTMREAILLLLTEKTKAFIKGCGAKLRKATYDIKLGYPGLVIIEEAKKKNQDLVIMGTEGHGQRHYLFIGRVANRVLVEIDRDILLVPPKKKNKK